MFIIINKADDEHDTADTKVRTVLAIATTARKILHPRGTLKRFVNVFNSHILYGTWSLNQKLKLMRKSVTHTHTHTQINSR